MKCFVRCEHCERTFTVNEGREGRYVFHCPSCGKDVGLLLLPTSKGLFPVVGAISRRRHQDHAGKPATSLEKAADFGTQVTSVLKNDEGANVHESEATKHRKFSFFRMAWTSFLWFLRTMWRFSWWTYRKIQLFRTRYRNADLVLFFVGSLLFMLLVVLGLLLAAQITIWMADVHSWFFKLYLKIKY